MNLSFPFPVPWNYYANNTRVSQTIGQCGLQNGQDDVFPWLTIVIVATVIGFYRITDVSIRFDSFRSGKVIALVVTATRNPKFSPLTKELRMIRAMHNQIFRRFKGIDGNHNEHTMSSIKLVQGSNPLSQFT